MKKRMIYNQNKYTVIYYRIINYAVARASTKKEANKKFGYAEQHHIIPECFFLQRKRKGPKGWLEGNPNSSENLVYLTAKEHFICHLLLPKMCEGHAKRLVELAFCQMCFVENDKQERYKVNSRWYQKAKIMNGKIVSILNTGRKHTESSIEKMSKSKLGKVFSEEHKQNLSTAHLGKTPWNKDKKGIGAGRVVSIETREKLSLVHKGKTISRESVEKAKATKQLNGPFKHSKEALEKISKASKNVSDETKAKRLQTRLRNIALKERAFSFEENPEFTKEQAINLAKNIIRDVQTKKV